MQMRKLSPLLLFLLAVVLGGLAVEAVQAGGWAVVTLQEWPDQVGAERPFSLRFAVRQHGLHLLGGLSPTVMAVHPNTGVTVNSVKIKLNLFFLKI